MSNIRNENMRDRQPYPMCVLHVLISWTQYLWSRDIVTLPEFKALLGRQEDQIQTPLAPSRCVLNQGNTTDTRRVQQNRLYGLLLDLLNNVAGLNHIPLAVELIDGVMHAFVYVRLMLGLSSSPH